MAQGKIERLWFKLLGGKAEHAGLGVMVIAILVAAIGASIAYYASRTPESSALYSLGYALGVAGIVGGWCGIIYHRVLSQRGTGSHRNDA